MHYAWTQLRDAAAAVAARWRARVTRIRAAPLSADWLRTHEIDAAPWGSGVRAGLPLTSGGVNISY